jgi:hypothetical protein
LADAEDGYASDNPGRVVAMCPATPGWWAVYGSPAKRFRAPVAAWVITESVIRLHPDLERDGGD